MSEPTTEPHPRCAHIATKTDYYRDPKAPPIVTVGAGETAIYWCVLTAKSIGPDEGPCNRADCNASRACYQPARRRYAEAD